MAAGSVFRTPWMRALAGAGIVLVLGSIARGDYLRCGNDLVTTGDVKIEVLKKCGEPALKEARVKEREVQVFDPKKQAFRSLSTTVHQEEWTYNFGPQQFLWIVLFEDGRVISIHNTRSYGF